MIFIEYGRKIINVVMEDISYTYISLCRDIYKHSPFSCSNSIKIEEIGTIGTRKKKKNTANLVPITWEQSW